MFIFVGMLFGIIISGSGTSDLAIAIYLDWNSVPQSRRISPSISNHFYHYDIALCGDDPLVVYLIHIG
jgi:hypothetical protein